MNDIREFMITQPPLCTPLTSIDFIQKLMDDSGSEEILVVDTLLEKHLVGSIDGNTITKRSVEQNVAPESLNAEQCMKPVSINVRETTSLAECLRVLNENNLSHLPIVDEQGHLCGIYDPTKNPNDIVRPEASVEAKPEISEETIQ